MGTGQIGSKGPIKMAIVFKLDADGGFTVGDTETRLTAYAYPASTYSQRAKRAPLAVAHTMLANQYIAAASIMEPYNARNWATLTA
jgi:hypothetical protein